MNAENTAHPIIRKTVKKLSLYLVSLLYLILLVIAASNFYESDCLLFGPEQIVGALNVGYHDNGSFYYTNPFAMLFRHVLYMLLIAALTWLAATGCESPRLPSTGFMKSMRRLLLACVFTGIFIGIGSGILSSTYRRNTELWQNVSSFHSLAQYKNYFGNPKYHIPEVNEENFEQFVQNSRMCNREFVLGKEVYVFSSTWPFRRVFVWHKNGQIVKTTWRCGL